MMISVKPVILVKLTILVEITIPTLWFPWKSQHFHGWHGIVILVKPVMQAKSMILVEIMISTEIARKLHRTRHVAKP